MKKKKIGVFMLALVMIFTCIFAGVGYPGAIQAQAGVNDTYVKWTYTKTNTLTFTTTKKYSSASGKKIYVNYRGEEKITSYKMKKASPKAKKSKLTVTINVDEHKVTQYKFYDGKKIKQNGNAYVPSSPIVKSVSLTKDNWIKIVVEDSSDYDVISVSYCIAQKATKAELHGAIESHTFYIKPKNFGTRTNTTQFFSFVYGKNYIKCNSFKYDEWVSRFTKFTIVMHWGQELTKSGKHAKKDIFKGITYNGKFIAAN